MTRVDGTQPHIRIRGIQIDRILPVRPMVCSFNSLFFLGLYLVFVLANQMIQTTQTGACASVGHSQGLKQLWKRDILRIISTSNSHSQIMAKQF